MRVREYALEQIHWILRKDPWVRAVFVAAGAPLDELAERILSIAYFEDADRLIDPGLSLWERILGLTPAPSATMAERRRAVYARWLAILSHPSVATIQAMCDALCPEQLEAAYHDGYLVLWRTDAEQSDRRALMREIGITKPAHIMLTIGDRRYLGIGGVSMTMTSGDITVSVPEGEE